MNSEVNKVSTRDVAAAAGVSATLVSWVAKGTATQHRISEATQRRVRATMEQLGYRPAMSGEVSSYPANNITTLLAAAGYRLVPVQTKEDLAVAVSKGLVGVVYRELRVESSGDTSLKMEGAALSAPVDEVVLTEPFDQAQGRQNPPLSETPPSVSEVAADVSAAEVADDDPPGTNAAGPSTSLRAGTSASTLVAEPVAEPEIESPAPSPSTTEQPDNLTTAPAFSQMEGAALSAPVSREAVEVTTPVSEARNPVSEVVPQPVESPAPPVEPVAAPTPTTPEAILEVASIPASIPPVVLTEPFDQAQGRPNPPLSETPPSVSEVAADVPAAEVADDDPPGTNAAGPSTSLRAGTSASTLVAEPVAEPEIESPGPSLSTTEQPDNLTTAPAFSQMEGAALVAGLPAVVPEAEVPEATLPAVSQVEPPAVSHVEPSAPVSRESVEVTTPVSEARNPVSEVVPQPVESPAPPVEPVAAPTPTTPEVILEVASIPASIPPVVLTEPFDQAQGRQNPPLSETPPSVSEVAADVSAAEESSEAQPGTNAAGPSTSLRAGTSASTLVAEPVAEPEIESPAPSPSTTEQPDNLTTAPAFSQMEGAAPSAPVSREAVEVTTPVSEARNPVSEVVPQPVESPAPPVEPVAAPTPASPEAILEVAPIPASMPPGVLTEPFDQAQGRQNPPLSETPPSVSEVAADVSAAEESSEAQPGTNAAGPSTSLRAGTSASTLVAEPVAEPEIESPAPSPSTTEQPDNLTTAPAFSQMEGADPSAPVSREAVEVTTPVSEARNPVSEVVPQPVESPAPPVEPVAAPTPTTPEAILEVASIPASMPPGVLTEPFDQAQGRQNPPLSETPPSVSEVAADVPAAEVADDDPPGTNAAGPSTSLRAGTSASTLVAEPVAEPEVESPAPPPETSMPTAPQA